MDAHVALEQVPPSPIDEIVEARFAFTDPRGRVTRWGAGAELLFGIAAEQIVGQPFFEVALAGADGGWCDFLLGERADSPPAGLDITVTRTDDQVFPCAVHLVPVLLSDGLDFSQFAADLSFDHADPLDAFKERHERVLGLIESAARGGARYAEGERLAGLIATFRPVGEVPVTPHERIDEALSRAERAEREVEDLRDPLTRVRGEFAELRAGLEGVCERVEALEARAADTDPEALTAQIEQAQIEQALAERLDRQLTARMDEVLPKIEQALAGRIEQTVAGRVEQALAGRPEQASAGAAGDLLARRVEEALGAAREAREEVEQLAREVRAGRGASAKPLPIGFYSSEAHPTAPDRPVLPEFDDVETPMAALSLDGRFIRLNGPFRDLVGYSEFEFASARWPSPADPEQIASQRELKGKLASGEIESAAIETAYMHREGLLVPLVGRMSLVRDDQGSPEHLLFTVGAA